MANKCCYYEKDYESEIINDLSTPTIINITVGPIIGNTPPDGGDCLQETSERMNANNMENGSIIQGVNINRIQVENIYFCNYGSLPIDAVIFDPPFYLKHKNKEHENHNPILPGCPKSFTIAIPPNTKCFMISVLAFRNFRYGQQWEDPSTPTVTNNLFDGKNNTNYREIYRFCWWIDITKNCVTYPIFCLGPYRNFSIPVPTCFPKVETNPSTNSRADSNTLITRWGHISKNNSSNLCPTTNDTTEENAGCGENNQCLQPFYNTAAGGPWWVNYSTANQCRNFAAGSNTQLGTTSTANAEITQGFFPVMCPNICSTTCASFVFCKKYKTPPCNPISDCNLAILNNTCCVSCLTLFTPSNFNIQ